MTVGHAIVARIFTHLLDEVGNYNYGPGHPMKPHRIRMVHSLLVNYGVYRELQIFVWVGGTNLMM